LDRAAAYLAAGADGIFVPGVTDLSVVALLAKGIAAPLNVLAGYGSPAVADLAAAGAARISLGSSIASAAYAVAGRVARELLESGTYESLAGSLEYQEINSLLH
jgi:2-methylisocitrate lyase-like PEP mutase family enzyme